MILLALTLAAQSSPSTTFNDAVTACVRENRVCIAVVEALAEDRRITTYQLRNIRCRAELFTAQNVSQAPHCNTASFNPPFSPAHDAPTVTPSREYDLELRVTYMGYYCHQEPTICPLVAMAGADHYYTVAEELGARAIYRRTRATRSLQSSTPPPNWEMTLPGARQFGKDGCSEEDLTDDPDDPVEVAACYAAYLHQRAIDAEEERQARHHYITAEDICNGAAPNRYVVITDEIHDPIICPQEPRP